MLAVARTPGESDAGVGAHVAQCQACARLIEKLRADGATRSLTSPAGTPPPPRLQAAALPRGTALGRYLLLDQIGEGGMGVVYAAYDPELDRKVALKVLPPARESSSSARGDANLRLVREAQALAQLSHPNVVAVYDVGTVEDRVFLAMELVEGQTLQHWLRAHRDDWRAVVALFRDAAAGVEAAHARGLVHRDLKPDNMLVGKDGRARVLDFGLARLSSEPPGPGPGPVRDTDTPTSSERALELAITQAGAVVGTPAYFAPETVSGAAPDARADQFSFCVALYEALYGQRPFENLSFRDARRWQVGEPPRGTKVPGWLRRVVLRGLSLDPALRYPSMAALRAALAVDPAQRIRRAWMAAAGLVVIAGAGVVAARLPRGPQMCQGAPARVESVWSAQAAARLSAAFLATKSPIAADAFAHVRETVDRYTAQWARMHTEACEATRLRGEQSDEVLSLRMACLEQRLKEVGALVEVLGESSAANVAQAPRAALALTPMDGCANVEALRAPVPLPPSAEGRARVETLREQLPRAKALLDAARFKEGLEVAQPLVAQARELRYRPLEAEALELLGVLQEKSGALKDAEQSYRASLTAAVAGGHKKLAAMSAARLSRAALLLAQVDAAVGWGEYARGALESLGGDSLIEAYLEMALGSLEIRRVHPELALPRFQRALELRTAALGASHPDVAAALNNLGAASSLVGKPAVSMKYMEQAAEIWTRALGPDHPETLQARLNLAILRLDFGALEQAKRELETVYAGYQRTLPPDHPLLLPYWANMAQLSEAMGDGPGAIEASLQNVALAEKIYGPDNPELGEKLRKLAWTQRHQHRDEDARQTLERAVRLAERPDAQATDLCAALDDLAGVLAALGRPREEQQAMERCLSSAEGRAQKAPLAYAEALTMVAERELAHGRTARAWPLLRKALQRYEALQKDSPDSILVHAAIARAHLTDGARDAALEHLEASLKLLEKPVNNLGAAGDIRFMLAKELTTRGGDKARARALAETARANYHSSQNETQVLEVNRWLAAH